MKNEIYRPKWPEWSREEGESEYNGKRFPYVRLRRSKHTERTAAQLFRWVPKWILVLWGAD